jgi:hypothetical protein
MNVRHFHSDSVKAFGGFISGANMELAALVAKTGYHRNLR